MSVNHNTPSSLPLGFRVLFGLAAIGMLLESAPWLQANLLQIALNIIGPVTFGLMALIDLRNNSFRNLAYGAAIVYIALVIVKQLGLAA